MKQILILTFSLFVLLLGCTSEDNSNPNASVNFTFTHTWDGAIIDQNNLTSIIVTNANGETLNFTRIRYLVSRFELVNVDTGATITFNDYKFTDLAQPLSYNFTPAANVIPRGNYRLKFIWGFNEEDNVDGAYPDLNSASWNWPAPLGGGYHFLQMDGQYNINSTPSNYNYHNGTARLNDDPPTFEQNFREISFDEIIPINGNSSIEVVMNFAEFFKNPHQWDLSVLDTPLMPNYMAQKMMQDNVATVFSLGDITQN
jgi:hypothetical protein